MAVVGYVPSKRGREANALRSVAEVYITDSVAGSVAGLSSVLRSILRRNAPQRWIVEDGSGLNALVVAILRLRGCSVVVRAKGAEVLTSPVAVMLQRRPKALLNRFGFWLSIRWATTVSPLTHWFAAELESKYGFLEGRCVVVPNDVPAIGSVANAERNSGHVVTVLSGSFDEKSQLLAEHVSGISRALSNSGYTWSIVGGGAALRDRAERDPHITYTDELPHEDVIRSLESAMALLYISALDVLPNVVLEAVVAGARVVVDSGSPVAGYVRDNELGVVFELGSEASLMAAITRAESQEATPERFFTENSAAAIGERLLRAMALWR